MKLFHISLLLFSALLLNGCIGEDMDSCPEIAGNNLTIEFLYKDESGGDIFRDKISKVDLFVFDRNGAYVTSQSIEQAPLSVFAGASLRLEPGIYRIVCWGNAVDRSVFGGVGRGSLFSDAFIGNSTLNGSSVATNGDKLYYAPYITEGHSLPQDFTINVPEQGTKTVPVTFGRVHIRVVAYVKGFEDRTVQGELLPPVIELADIPRYYNFEMQTFGDYISYWDLSSFATVEGEQMAVMEFNTPLFTEDTPIQLLIKKQSDGTTVTTVSLEHFIRENNITIGNSIDLVLPILVEYKSGSFEIVLPGWGHTPVGPEF